MRVCMCCILDEEYPKLSYKGVMMVPWTAKVNANIQTMIVVRFAAISMSFLLHAPLCPSWPG